MSLKKDSGKISRIKLVQIVASILSALTITAEILIASGFTPLQAMLVLAVIQGVQSYATSWLRDRTYEPIKGTPYSEVNHE